MHVLGIDAGGSKTVALLARLDGRVVAEGRAGGANLRTHGELLVENLIQLIDGKAFESTLIVPELVVRASCGVRSAS